MLLLIQIAMHAIQAAFVSWQFAAGELLSADNLLDFLTGAGGNFSSFRGREQLFIYS